MRGRAAVIAQEFRPVAASAVHVLAPTTERGGVTVENLTVWSMGCASKDSLLVGL